MDTRRWSKLKAIVADALSEESPTARSAFVERICAEDKELRQEAASLLAEAEVILEEGDDLEACAENAAVRIAREDYPERTGERIGAYVVVRKIDQGGMGTVYLAARADGCFEKHVAIKILKQGAFIDDLVRRFRAEREVLARLDHPNIARLIDAGTTDDGLPYFIMEYVDGIPVTQFAKEKCGTLRLCLELFLKIAAAVEAAHSAAVIHRDLKPSNILVNREGEPKLLDFGIAKLLTDEVDGYPQTISGQERLTPIFASPEQMEGKDVTRSSDVYSLGVVLYEILTSSPPFHFPTERPTLTQITRAICDQVPIRPSEAVKDRKRGRELRGTVDAIVLRALRKDPSQRYSSVAQFAADIRNCMEGPALGYRSTETFDQARSFHSRRLRSVAILAALIVAIIGAGSVQELFRRPETSENRDTSASRVPSDANNMAVLASGPLATQERDRDLTDGIRDGILSNLTKAADLKMVSGNSVERYRESEKRTEEIDGPLKVQDLAPGRGPKEKVPVKLFAEPNAKVTSQAATDEKTLRKERKKLVWIPKQIGSNLPAHWAEVNSAEARDAATKGGYSVEDIQNRQNQTVSTMPTVFVGHK